MTHLRPCHRCRHRDGCSLKAEIHDFAKGAPVRLTLANFSCPFRLDGLEPGRLVIVQLPKLEPYIEHPSGAELVCRHPGVIEARGVIMEEATGKRAGRLRLWMLDTLDDTDDAAMLRVIHAWPDQMRPTEEMVPICATCLRPMDAELDEWGCGQAGRHLDGESLSLDDWPAFMEDAP